MFEIPHLPVGRVMPLGALTSLEEHTFVQALLGGWMVGTRRIDKLVEGNFG